MNLLLRSTLILAITLHSCEKQGQENSKIPDGISFTIGTTCGWCAGTDSLVITKEEMSFVRNQPCENNSVKETDPTRKEDWITLTDLFDKDEFSKITINTCNVCVDGCDTWIRVKDDDYSHQIRFGSVDSEIPATILPFVNRLDSFRLHYRSQAVQ